MATSKKTESEKTGPELWVKREKSNFVTIGFKGEISVKVYPGLNRIKDPVILAAIENDEINANWKVFIEKGTHKLVSGNQQKSKSKTSVFTAMANDDSISMIKETYSIPALEQLYSDEQTKKARPGVLNAIQDQIKEVKTPDTQEKANS